MEVAALREQVTSLEVDRRALRGVAEAERTAALLQGQAEVEQPSQEALPSPEASQAADPAATESLRQERDLLARQLEAAEATLATLRERQTELVEQVAKAAIWEAPAQA